MKPIIFSTEMIEAILEGRKTQTRRVIKTRPKNRTDFVHISHNLYFEGSEKFTWAGYGNPDDPVYFMCHYKPDDILWVRETWCLADNTDEIIYKSDNPSLSAKWRPSIYMPRKAARLFLRVKNVRVERLQDITEIEATHEGIIKHLGIHARDDFAKLWDSINGKRGYGWDTNPWIWVIEFERMEK